MSCAPPHRAPTQGWTITMIGTKGEKWVQGEQYDATAAAASHPFKAYVAAENCVACELWVLIES